MTLPTRPARARRIFWTLLKAAFGLALLGWLWWSGRIELGRFAAAREAPGLVAAALAVTALVPCLAALRWSLLVRAQGLALTPLRALRLELIASFFNIFLPGATAGGDLARAYYLARDEQRRTVAVTTVAFDRILGLACMLGLSTLGLLLHLDEVRANPELAWLLLVAGGGSLASAGLAGFFFSRRLHGWRARLWERLAPGSTGGGAALPGKDEGGRMKAEGGGSAGPGSVALDSSFILHPSSCQEAGPAGGASRR
jgi:uncharacterized membrane protein YbhN (UPF0104 family)